MLQLEYLKAKLKEKVGEVSTWDGAVLIAGGVAVLFVKSIVAYIAYAAILYGAYKIYKKG
mgnify:FL=1|tara:strand:- start:96 stop:275 length:180 start_codon:yes stop_codon:yes gene_type:complete